GHLEAVAGLVGMCKAVLALEHGAVPPHLHLKEPNPLIPWDELPMKVATSLTPWPEHDGPRRAAVSSFGFSGTNAHVVLEQPPAPERSTPSLRRPMHVVTLSARGDAALHDLARRYLEY